MMAHLDAVLRRSYEKFGRLPDYIILYEWQVRELVKETEIPYGRRIDQPKLDTDNFILTYGGCRIGVIFDELPRR